MTDHGPETISQAQAAAQPKPSRRTRIPFPLAGGGAFLLYTFGSMIALEEAANRIMSDWLGRGFTAFGVMERLLLDGNPAAVRAAIDAGLKREIDGKVVPISEIDLDNVEWSVAEVVEPALNALAIAYFNKPYADLIAEATAAAQARAAEARKAWEDSKTA